MMDASRWFIRKTTHGFSLTAHTGFIFGEKDPEQDVVLFHCNAMTKVRISRTRQVGSDYPKRCPLCVREVTRSIKQKLRGDPALIAFDREGIKHVWGYTS